MTTLAAAGLDQTVALIVERVLGRVQPELILLFGSRARGHPRDDSDYDLMLVMRDQSGVESAPRAAREALQDLGVAIDVLAVSADDYQRRQHDPGFLSYIIARNGRLLYTTGVVLQRSVPSRHVKEEPPREGLELWIPRAEADMRIAEDSLAASAPVWDAICLHSHACIEKLFKALIVQHGTFPPRTHDLYHLRALQSPPIDTDVEVAAACTVLMDLFPKSRYPEAGDPTPNEARQALDAARRLRQRLLPALGR